MNKLLLTKEEAERQQTITTILNLSHGALASLEIVNNQIGRHLRSEYHWHEFQNARRSLTQALECTQEFLIRFKDAVSPQKGREQ